MSQEVVARGLENVVVASTHITLVDGERNRLAYRGYDVGTLARHSTYEEVAFLLWRSRFPAPPEFQQTLSHFRESYETPVALRDLVGKIPHSTKPLDALRTGMSALSPLLDGTPSLGEKDLEGIALQLTAMAPRLVTDFWRATQGLSQVSPPRELGHAANLLCQITGQDPNLENARALDAMMILHADHEMNTSTFAARVAASTGSDMASAVTAALATLKGPLHGGAGELVMEMVKEIGDPSQVAPFVTRRLARHERLMGFGHRIYQGEDPRATVIREIARELATRRSNLLTFEILEALAKTVRKERGLFPNVDLYSGAVYELLGIPRSLHASVFALGRMAGWTAHVIEEYAQRKLICPIARYEGPRDLAYPVTATTRMSG